MTSVRFVPKMRLVNLPAGASLPLPYDGRGSITGHSFISYIILFINTIKNKKNTELAVAQMKVWHTLDDRRQKCNGPHYGTVRVGV